MVGARVRDATSCAGVGNKPSRRASIGRCRAAGTNLVGVWGRLEDLVVEERILVAALKQFIFPEQKGREGD